MPYLSKYNRYLFWTGLAWWFLLPFGWIFTIINTRSITIDLGFPLVLALMADVLLFMFTAPLAAAPHKPQCVFWFHCGFTFWSSLWVGRPQLFRLGIDRLFVRPHFEWTTVFACLTSILYLAAVWKGDNIVLSKTLGGPGVEPMSLTLHNSEPEYNTITDEGRIRLV